MLNLIKNKLPLAVKFHLTVVVPLILVSIAVSTMTFRGLEYNASHLAEVLTIESKTNRILSLLLVQDDASKAILIDPNQLETFSTKKIEAYDDHKKLLSELGQEAGSKRFHDLIHRLQEIDEKKLRPIDSLVLEKLFEDVDLARKMYFDQYEAHKKDYEKLIRELAAIGVEDLNKASEELHNNNMRSLLHIILTLLFGIALIMATITILSRQVEKSNRNTRSLLKVLSEGLFFFDQNGMIAKERSQTLQIILPDSPMITNIYEFVRHYAPAAENNVKLCLQMLWGEDDSDFFSDIDSTLSLLPRDFTLSDQRIIHLEYRPLRDAKNKLERIVVVVSDVTQSIQTEKESRSQAERIKKISRAAARRDDYLSFLEEAKAIFKRADLIFQKSVSKLSSEDIQDQKRDLHTLKGTLATADFKQIATELHKLESMIDERGLQHSGITDQWQKITEQWQSESSDIDQVLGLSHRTNRISIDRTKFELIQQHATSQKDHALRSLLMDCQRQPPHEIFARYTDYLQNTAGTLEKEVSLTFDPNSDELAAFEVQKLDAIFNHILRNSVDHGIENPDKRQSAGKPAHGSIQWAVFRKPDGALHFIIQDDGQGVNTTKLAQKAVKTGIWTEEQAQVASEQQKVELLFLPQLSSRDEVTELSGRGVGMDAVKELVLKLGGTISVQSRPGVGTRFEITIPSQGSQPLDQQRRIA